MDAVHLGGAVGLLRGGTQFHHFWSTPDRTRPTPAHEKRLQTASKPKELDLRQSRVGTEAARCLVWDCQEGPAREAFLGFRWLLRFLNQA